MKTENILTHAKKYGIPIIRSESHEFLQKLIKKENPKHILEIGTAVGYSGIAMLSQCNGHLTTIEHDESSVKQAQKNFKAFKMQNRVDIIHGDCLVEIAKMVASKEYDNYFDLIFLDGPKAQYDLMLNSLIMLLKPNGVFVADNVLFRGYVQNNTKAPTKRYKTIIQRLNSFIDNCKNHPKLKDFKLNDIEDGIITAKKVQNEK